MLEGKNKPGYRWACPRYGPTGADMGGIVWANWQRTAKGLLEPPFGLMYERTGAPFSLQNFNTASGAVLQEHLGMQETEMFSSLSLRRSMLTLAEMCKTHPDDADALGDWTASKDSKMRVRYADSRDERAVLIKTAHVGRSSHDANPGSARRSTGEPAGTCWPRLTTQMSPPRQTKCWLLTVLLGRR